jgi:hypothetical protein
VELLGGYSNFGPETELPTIGEASGGINHYNR